MPGHVQLATKRYWPFDILPQDHRTEQHESQVNFLEAAYKKGFEPFAIGSDFGATFGLRNAEFIYRSRHRWEVRLDSNDREILSAYVEDFFWAGAGALEWLDGNEITEILERLKPHLVPTRSNPSGYVVNAGPRKNESA